MNNNYETIPGDPVSLGTYIYMYKFCAYRENLNCIMINLADMADRFGVHVTHNTHIGHVVPANQHISLHDILPDCTQSDILISVR